MRPRQKKYMYIFLPRVVLSFPHAVNSESVCKSLTEGSSSDPAEKESSVYLSVFLSSVVSSVSLLLLRCSRYLQEDDGLRLLPAPPNEQLCSSSMSARSLFQLREIFSTLFLRCALRAKKLEEERTFLKRR